MNETPETPQWRKCSRVVIPKGTPFVYATSPRMQERPTHNRATHTVKVHNITKIRGQVDRLWWAGPGGYWRVVEITPELLAANGVKGGKS